MGQIESPRTESFSIRGQNYEFIIWPGMGLRPIK